MTESRVRRLKRIGPQTLLMFVLPLAFEVLLLVALISLLLQANSKADRLEDSQKIVSCISQIDKSLFLMPLSAMAAETPQINWSGPSARDSYDLWRTQTELLTQLLKMHYPEQFVRELSSLFSQIRGKLDRMSSKRISNPLTFVQPSQSSLKLQSQIEDATQTCRQIVDNERKVCTQLPANTLECYRDFLVMIGFGFMLNVLFAALLAAFVFFRVIQPLKRIQSGLRTYDLLGRYASQSQSDLKEIEELNETFEKVTAQLSATLYGEQAIFENAGDPILWLDSEKLTIKSCNLAALALFEKEQAEIEGKKIHSLIPKFEEFRSTINSTSTLTAKINLSGRNEIEAIISSTDIASFDETACIIHDITERKSREDKQREQAHRISSILHSMLVSVLIVDKNFCISSCNKMAEELLELSETQMVGRPVSEVLGENSLKVNTPHSNAGPLTTRKVQIQTSQRGRVIFEMSVAELNEGTDGKLLINLLDITERARTEELKDWLVNMISHDLRTPLASILTSLELFTMGSFGPITAGGLSNISTAITHLKQLIELINNFLDLEKIESGSWTLQLKKLSLPDFMKLTMSQCATVEQCETGNSVTFIQADSVQLKEAFGALEVSLIDLSSGMFSVTATCANQSLVIEFTTTSPVEQNRQNEEYFWHGDDRKSTRLLLAMRDIRLAKAFAIIELHKGQAKQVCKGNSTQIVVTLPITN